MQLWLKKTSSLHGNLWEGESGPGIFKHNRSICILYYYIQTAFWVVCLKIHFICCWQWSAKSIKIVSLGNAIKIFSPEKSSLLNDLDHETLFTKSCTASKKTGQASFPGREGKKQKSHLCAVPLTLWWQTKKIPHGKNVYQRYILVHLIWKGFFWWKITFRTENLPLNILAIPLVALFVGFPLKKYQHYTEKYNLSKLSCSHFE